MIQLMSSGGYKVFSPEGIFIGAYNNLNLAEAINEKGAPLTSKEFDTLFGVTPPSDGGEVLLEKPE